MENQKTRAFIAVTFPDEVIREVARIHSLLQKKKFTGKITELENLHLTLKFLGEIDQQTLNKSTNLLDKITLSSFHAKLKNPGVFSFRDNPRIVWIEVGGKKMFELQKQVDHALHPLFPKEQRFMSHLTIARIKYVKDKQSFTEYINNIPVKPLAFPVTSFKLISSELRPLGPIYTTLKEFPLTHQQ